MEKVNALRVRQGLGKILKQLASKGEPILIEKGRKPVAVLIPYKTFNERFIDYHDQQRRAQLLELFEESAVTPAEDSLRVLRQLRYGSDH